MARPSLGVRARPAKRLSKREMNELLATGKGKTIKLDWQIPV